MVDEKKAVTPLTPASESAPKKLYDFATIEKNKFRPKVDDRLTESYRQDNNGKILAKRANGTYEIRKANGDLEWVGPIDAIPTGYVPEALQKARDWSDPQVDDYQHVDVKKEIDILAVMQGETDTRKKAEEQAASGEGLKVQTEKK